MAANNYTCTTYSGSGRRCSRGCSHTRSRRPGPCSDRCHSSRSRSRRCSLQQKITNFVLAFCKTYQTSMIILQLCVTTPVCTNLGSCHPRSLGHMCTCMTQHRRCRRRARTGSLRTRQCSLRTCTHKTLLKKCMIVHVLVCIYMSWVVVLKQMRGS